MLRKLVLFCLLLSLSAPLAFSQTVAADKKEEELKKEATAFLKETSIDVDNLRTLENRVSFSAEIASLMWYQDEKEAQTMFQKVIIDFRQLMTQLDTQYTSIGTTTGGDESLLDDSPDAAKRKLQRKFGKAVSVRQQVALSIAEHDPQMAYDFFNSTAQVVTNPELRAQFAERDSYFEIKLIYAIAEKDPDKALEAGRRLLAKGFSLELIELLKKIYEKDADKGIAFGEEVVSKIKTDSSKSISFYLYSSLLGAGEESLLSVKKKPGKKPMLSEQSMREIADLLGQELLKRDDTEAGEISGYLSQVEKYSPARAVAVRQKFRLAETKKNDVKSIAVTEADVITETDSYSANVANQEDIFQTAKNIGQQMSREEREKAVKESRAAIAKIKNREQKMLALSFLSAQIAFAGDKEMAAEIMNEARSLVNLQPKNYKDFLGVWLLASGYAASDADKSFPLLEDAISRLNETISGFIKVAEFLDVDEEILEGDEFQVGVFGGGMIREMLGALGSSNLTLRILASSDFARTKALTNRFDRPEVRILAKMLVLRAVLGDAKAVKSE